MSSSPMPASDVIAAAQAPCCRYARFHAGRVRRERFYPSDMTDAEWEVLEPLLPVPACATAGGGHPERYCRREIVDAIRYLVDQGCKWRALPRDFAPFMWNLISQARTSWVQTASGHELRFRRWLIEPGASSRAFRE